MGPFEDQVESLHERVYELVANGTVWLNPMPSELDLAFGRGDRARGIVEGPNVYVWSDGAGVHKYIALKLHLKMDIPFYIDREDDTFVVYPSEWSGGCESDLPTLENHPKIRRMCGNAPIMAMCYSG